MSGIITLSTEKISTFSYEKGVEISPALKSFTGTTSLFGIGAWRFKGVNFRKRKSSEAKIQLSWYDCISANNFSDQN